MYIRPLVLSQADHAALPATKAGSNEHRNLDGVRVLQSSLGEPVLRNSIDSRRTDDIGSNITYRQLQQAICSIPCVLLILPSASAEATATSTSLKGCVIANDWMSSTDASL